MQEIKMKLVRILREDNTMVNLPEYATAGSACMDFYSANLENIAISPGGTVLVPLGIKVAVDVGYQLLLFPRSGMAIKYGASLANCVGVIDSDYRGEVMAGIYNHSDQKLIIEPSTRVCQGQLMEAPQYKYTEVLDEEALGGTVRGEGGFNSTGKGVISNERG